jgi:hypothetical protein
MVDGAGGLGELFGPGDGFVLAFARKSLGTPDRGLENAANDEQREPEVRSKLKQAASVLGSLATQLAINALGGAAGNVLSS